MWILTVLRIPDDELIRCMGLDRFMVLKFLRMGLFVFGTFSIFALPILIPINVINQRNSPGLNILTMGNVSDPSRTWAHLILSVLLSAGVIWYTFHETRKYLVLRRRYILSPEFTNSVMSRTLYVPSVPKDVNNVDDLMRIFGKFPGGVRRIWLNRNLKELPDIVEERQKNVQNLETAVTKAILASYKHYAKADSENPEIGRDTSLLIPEKLRPTHRVSPLPIGLPFVGRKVDSIEYYGNEIKNLNEKIATLQQSVDTLPQLNSVFIEFNEQIAVHMAAQTLIHHGELKMAPRNLHIAPTDVIWENMNIRSKERLLRRMLSLAITSVIVIFWAIPVIFVQSISSLDALSETFPFLNGVKKLGPTAVGIIQGILPAVALAILVALVPIVFAALSTREGIPQKSFVELSVLHKYFFFLFIDVVLVSTIAGGVFQTWAALSKNPTSIVNVLAEKLPQASTFFITYVMLQAINASGQAMLQLVPFLLSYVFPLFATTPRDIYNQKSICPNVNLGTLIPSHSVIFVLGLEYSTIAPLILPFVCLFFALHYFVYLYQFLYVYERDFETGGRAFPRAIRHVYIGLYTWQLTMIGLFAVRKDNALGQLVIMIITLIVSCFALALYDKSFRPLFKFLPVDCVDVEYTTERGETIGHKVRTTSSKDEDRKVLVSSEQESDAASRVTSELDASKPSVQHIHAVESESGTSTISADACATYLRLHKELDQALHQTASNHVEPSAAMMATAKEVYESFSYLHPSMRQEQPVVWLPLDDIGITEAEIKHLKSLGILATSSGATAHANARGKGKVEIDEEDIIKNKKGIPGVAPKPGWARYVNDYVRTVVDSYNFIASF
ncbi:hypothetical protein EC973_009370 [Apophysomyces ossiformis]|uniref:DUF221-domain-containing protein n=1 Tax=Apophysomyces ossiformis TaxID=679940 RepID=A0A8H7ETR2_9FUNG|nr:hypothetical protein EC973_009370 [Apophysomyces ossiformis]